MGTGSSVTNTPGDIPKSRKSLAHFHHWRPTRVRQENICDILDCYDTLIIDCDGVLWSKDQLSEISNVKESLQKLASANKRLIFVSNNSLYSRLDYKEKIKTKVGYDVRLADMFAIDYAIAVYLAQIVKVSGTVYVIGRQGLADELALFGLNSVGVGLDPDPVPTKANDLLTFDLHQDVSAVAVGFDSYFGYNKLVKASCYLSNPSCEFVVSSEECSLKMQKKLIVPLEGSFVASLTAACGRTPVVVGKPHKFLFDCIQSVNPTLNKERTLMIGDTLETDVLFAKNAGIDSLLVLSGSCSGLDLERLVLKDNRKMNTECLPEYVMNSIGELHLFL